MNRGFIKRAIAPVKIYSRIPEHRAQILSLYRDLLKQSSKVSDSVVSTFLRGWIRERFRYNRHLNSKPKLQDGINNALKLQITLGKALSQQQQQQLQRYATSDDNNNNTMGEDMTLLADFAYGRQGRLFYIIEQIKLCSNLKKASRFLSDIRPVSSIKKDPEPCYAIPFDERIFEIPLSLKKAEERKKRKIKIRNLRSSSLLSTPMTVLSSKSTSSSSSSSSPAFLSAKISSVYPSSPRNSGSGSGRNKNAIKDESLSRRELKKYTVLTSSNIRFTRIKGRTQPQWLSVMIKKLTLRLDFAVKKMKELENYYDDMLEEQEFLERLGINDSGYLPSIKSAIEAYSQRANSIKNKKF